MPMNEAINLNTKALKDAINAAREFAVTMDAVYESACEDDPGLEAAVAEAQASDPDIGWLDVALKRSDEGVS